MSTRQKILCVAPHPDDETLGCGGTLLRHADIGDEIYWLIVTDMQICDGYDAQKVARRQATIEAVANEYQFKEIYNLNLTPAKLDIVAKNILIPSIGEVFSALEPTVVYLPFRGDIHSDHAMVFDSVVSCTKWFRYPSVSRILCYETLSETDFNINPESLKFTPNSFNDISSYIDKKLQIAKLYQEEIGSFPFPRSIEALRALANVRGVACGCKAAESFMLLKEINK